MLNYPLGDLWSRIVPFPPGWWEGWRAMRALGAKDFVAARKLALQILEENERWKQDVREHGFAQHPWVWKDDNDKFHALNPDVLVDLILRAAEEQ